MKNNRLLVIIVSYNSIKWAKRCYDSLRLSDSPCDILTIDNGSTDGTLDYIRQHYPEVEIIETGENLGFGRANNIGLQRVIDEGYDYAYLLNQDAWIFPNTFSKLMSVHQENPEYGVLSPMQMTSDELHFDQKFLSNTLRYHQKSKPYLIEDLYFGRSKSVYDVSFVMAAHWLISRKCIEIVGGFSPTFPHYGEDDNYLNRCIFWKFKVGVVPSSRAVHDRADSNWSQMKSLYIYNYISCLSKASNPLDRSGIWIFIWNNLKNSIRLRNAHLWNYSMKLLKEKCKIEKNYQQSLKKTAFLCLKKEI